MGLTREQEKAMFAQLGSENHIRGTGRNIKTGYGFNYELEDLLVNNEFLRLVNVSDLITKADNIESGFSFRMCNLGEFSFSGLCRGNCESIDFEDDVFCYNGTFHTHPNTDNLAFSLSDLLCLMIDSVRFDTAIMVIKPENYHMINVIKVKNKHTKSEKMEKLIKEISCEIESGVVSESRRIYLTKKILNTFDGYHNILYDLKNNKINFSRKKGVI